MRPPNPHLALAAIVHAGVQGIEEGLAVPEATQEDLSLLSAEAPLPPAATSACHRHSKRPQRFKGNADSVQWFPEGFADVYVKHKEGEIAYLADKTQTEICAAYDSVY